jgi:hypothetical protein
MGSYTGSNCLSSKSNFMLKIMALVNLVIISSILLTCGNSQQKNSADQIITIAGNIYLFYIKKISTSCFCRKSKRAMDC